MTTNRFVSLCLALLGAACNPSGAPLDVIVTDGGALPDQADAGPPPITWGACPDRFRDECAVIAMPLDHARPEAGTIDIFVSRGRPGSKQLWLLQGGPGASAESFFGLHDFLLKLDPELEVYTIEHRGVGDSTRLGCGGEDEGSVAGTQIAAGEWPACRDEVKATWGERLPYFSTTQAAHDLALAIERTRRPGQRVFVYGGSYGTYWANRFAVLHPDLADGVVLDAPVQPDAQLERYDLAFDPIGRRVLKELCPLAPRCAAHLGPDPLAYFERVFKAVAGGRCGVLGVDLATWKTVFGVFLMDYNLRNWLPALAYRLDRCAPKDRTAIATLFSNIFKGGELPRTSKILQVHVLLSELFPRTHVDDAELVAAGKVAMFFQNANANTFQMQDTWPRYAPDPRAAEYAPPRLPVLTLAGAFDPAAPPALVGYGFRDNLKGPHQTFVEIPFGAHTVLTTGSVGPDMPACPLQLVRAFVADPSAPLPVECAAKVLTPSFDAPADLAMKFWGTADIYD